MFYCKAGHLTEPRVKMILMPVRYRLVETNHHIQCSESKKSWFVTGSGEEIAKEEAFCPEHVDPDWDIEEELVRRNHTFHKSVCKSD